MRVIAGQFKSRVLKMPKVKTTRPTSQMVKKALFDTLGVKVSGSLFLELFAGGGGIGIEALSRGAGAVVLVDNNRSCIKTITENLKALNVEFNYRLELTQSNKDTSVTVLAMPVDKVIPLLVRKLQKFDLVFLDPPYHEDKLKNSLIKIDQYDILNPQCWVIAEHYKKQELPQQLKTLRLMFTKQYGDAALSFFQRQIKK